MMTNVTFSMDSDLLKKSRKLAVEKNTTLSELIRNFLRESVRKDERTVEAARKELSKMMATGKVVMGKRTWTRESLYDR